MNIIDAILRNDLAKVQQLLGEGADPNFTEDIAHITPLHHAAQHGLIEIAKILVTAGANVNAVTEEGLTPLAFAKIHGNKEMIKLLTKLQNFI